MLKKAAIIASLCAFAILRPWEGAFTGLFDRHGDATTEIESIPAKAFGEDEYTYYLKVGVEEDGLGTFHYSLDGENFTQLGEPFQAQPGVWIGAKVGLFSLSPNVVKSEGYADFDWFRMK